MITDEVDARDGEIGAAEHHRPTFQREIVFKNARDFPIVF
jgi:hypothetical protein